MTRTAILFNPSSGKGRSLKQKAVIEGLLKAEGVTYDLWVTESEDHLRSLAAKTAEQYDVIVAVGGDTTFNITAQQIIKKRKAGTFGKNGNSGKCEPALGMIGTGSANDIVRGLGLEKIEAACKAIKRGKTAQMDVGNLRIDGQPEPLFFLGTLSLGLGTTVNRYVEEFSANHKFLAGWKLIQQSLVGMAAIRHSFSSKKVPLGVELEYRAKENETADKTRKIIKKNTGNITGNITGNVKGNVTGNNAGDLTGNVAGKGILKRETVGFSLLVFLNIPYYANGLQMVKTDAVPAETLFDRRLDCCIVNSTSFAGTLKSAVAIQRGRAEENNGVRLLNSEFFRVRSAAPLEIQVDGDIFSGVNGFEVSLVPEGLKVLI